MLGWYFDDVEFLESRYPDVSAGQVRRVARRHVCGKVARIVRWQKNTFMCQWRSGYGVGAVRPSIVWRDINLAIFSCNVYSKGWRAWLNWFVRWVGAYEYLLKLKGYRY